MPLSFPYVLAVTKAQERASLIHHCVVQSLARCWEPLKHHPVLDSPQPLLHALSPALHLPHQTQSVLTSFHNCGQAVPSDYSAFHPSVVTSEAKTKSHSQGLVRGLPNLPPRISPFILPVTPYFALHRLLSPSSSLSAL